MEKELILKASYQRTGEPEQQLEDVFMVARRDKEDGQVAVTFIGKPKDAISLVETLVSAATRIFLADTEPGVCLMSKYKEFKCDIRDALETGLKDGADRATRDLMQKIVERGLYDKAHAIINSYKE